MMGRLRRASTVFTIFTNSEIQTGIFVQRTLVPASAVELPVFEWMLEEDEVDQIVFEWMFEEDEVDQIAWCVQRLAIEPVLLLLVGGPCVPARSTAHA